MEANLIVMAITLISGYVFQKIYRGESNSDKVRKKYIRFICFVLILQSGLRNVAVGIDTYNYFLIFEEIRYTSWNEIIQNTITYYSTGDFLIRDPGYSIIQKLFQTITTDFQLFLIFIAILFFSAFGHFLYKNSKRLSDVIIAFLIYSVLFYFFFSITGQRQTIATALLLFSFEYIKKRKLLPFLLLVMIASTVHKSALVFIPLYFVSRIVKTRLFYRVILILFPVFLVFNGEIAGFLSTLGGYEGYSQFLGSGTYVFTVFFLLISLVALIRSKYIIKSNPNAQNYFNAFAFALLFLPLTWFHPSTMRIVQYFSIFMTLFIPEIIHSFNHISIKLRNGVARMVIILLIGLYLKMTWNSDITYGFYWQKMRLPVEYDLVN